MQREKDMELHESVQEHVRIQESFAQCGELLRVERGECKELKERCGVDFTPVKQSDLRISQGWSPQL